MPHGSGRRTAAVVVPNDPMEIPMKLLRYSLLALCLLASLGLATDAQATIGWAGNVWPLSGSLQVPTGPLTVYAQVWKDGVTPGVGQGADIAAALFYKTDLDPTEYEVAMVYQGEVGNNDEYKGDVPQAALAGAAWVEVHVVFTDLTDMTTYTDVKDQNSQGPPQTYSITNVLPNDVNVTFTLCMSGTPTTGAPCVIGNQAPIGNWGTGVAMNLVSGELYNVTVTFPAGSSPALEYKYKADDCTNWESVGNRSVTLPTDGTTSVNLAADSYNNAPLGCDLNNLNADKEVCFEVCMAGVTIDPAGVCVVGSGDLLTNWGAGVPMTAMGGDIYRVCITYLAGTPMQTVEFKYKKDGCNTWESVGNRSVVVNNDSPATQTFHNTWDDGTGVCTPVAVPRTSWGKVKTIYR
jgi:hypothetical protein